MLKSFLTAAVVSALVAASTAMMAVHFWPDNGGEVQPTALIATPTTSTSASAADGSSSGQASLNSACLAAPDIYERLRPAVVEITSTATSRSPFGQPTQGAGSGIVIDEQGSILTNYHVVAGADSLEVKFADGTAVSAHVVGGDPSNDLAVIQADVSQQDLAPARLGDSDAVRVGDPALAIGNPFNLEGTLTQGIISGLGRTHATGGDTRPLRDLIQTDAPVNPGNSGGPLLNCYGEVIGVNALLENPTGADVNVGIAFAVPINTAERFLPDMLAGETVSHPWLGIAGLEITPALAKDLGLPVEEGVYVTLVAAGSPAEDAGLHGALGSEREATRSSSVPRGGDVIVAADDQAVASVEDLASYLDMQKKPGGTAKLQVFRDGQKLSVEVTLAEWPQ